MKEIIITPPEGYEVDKENSSFEKIVFKPIDIKPRSWEEYCANTKRNGKYFINPIVSDIIKVNGEYKFLDTKCDKNLLPTKELAEAFLAMMQLMSLRYDWIHKWSIDNEMTDDWEPDWTDDVSKKWCVTFSNYKLHVSLFLYTAIPLSFPTQEMAKDFMNCFKDLLEVAKPLI